MRPHTARKRTGGSNGNTPTRQKTRRESKMRPRTAQKHAGKAMGALPRAENAPRRQNVSVVLSETWLAGWSGMGCVWSGWKIGLCVGYCIEICWIGGGARSVGAWEGVPCRVRGVLQSAWGMFLSCAGRVAAPLVAKRSCASTFFGRQLQGSGRLDPKCGIRGICGVFCNGLCRCIEFSGPLAHGRLAYAVWAMPHKSCMVA